MPALDQAEAQAIHVSIRPEEFIKMNLEILKELLAIASILD